MTEGLWSRLSSAESLLRESEDKIARLRDMQTALTDLVGRAETADGRVVVEFEHGKGLTTLELDPKAMRMPSEDLAAAIKQAITEANEDLRWKVAEAVSASGAPTAVSAEEAQAQMAAVREQLLSHGRAAAEGFERASALLQQRNRPV
ncbi:YbaB/EbfC family nucleoid-associated protein [Jatrophihabitans endophyticus]|uniref:YbaB/EbfC family nucleoid-associated protein n=1 Tax=Jatrophihabitans endophyticus TaxID=1206085 RepID=UPI0019FD53D5|nr:YbaB/EbfC family nucleoid-associated protein [Jatrophihabitans endophyticus]MBE7186736.1 YbaB/EbfC family nucleoid-associated protein [Jatrophihabitans endophyticus]